MSWPRLFHTHHVGLHSFAIFGAPLINVLARLIGANEADSLDGRMVTNKIHSCGGKNGDKVTANTPINKEES